MIFDITMGMVAIIFITGLVFGDDISKIVSAYVKRIEKGKDDGKY